MKSEYEKLSDTAMFKFLQVIMKEVIENFNIKDERDLHKLPKSSFNDEVKDTLKVLINYGIKLGDLDRNYFWTTFILSSNKVWGQKKLEGYLTRPKLKEYLITLNFRGTQIYTEESTQTINYYNLETAKDIYNNDEFSPYGGDYNNYQTHDTIESEWELDDIEELGEVKESKLKKTNIIKENFESRIDGLTVHQLMRLQEAIENKIRDRIRLV